MLSKRRGETRYQRLRLTNPALQVTHTAPPPPPPPLSFPRSYTAASLCRFPFHIPSFVHFRGSAHKSSAGAHTCSRLLLTFSTRRSHASHHFFPSPYPSSLSSSLHPSRRCSPSLIRRDAAGISGGGSGSGFVRETPVSLSAPVLMAD